VTAASSGFPLFCWIFTTIRAVHLVNVKFWRIPSTYIALVGGVIAFLVCPGMFLYAEDSASRLFVRQISRP
jgi:hypothetical protein